jgi:uncharacterized delta-60 repeat protein
MKKSFLMSITVVAMIAIQSSALALPGDLDLSFGEGGVATSQVGNFGAGRANELVSDLAVQPDGKIIAVGPIYNGFDWDSAITRFHPDGSLDVSFGDNGTTFSSVSISAVVLQEDGKVVVAGALSVDLFGFSTSDFAVSRYHPNGSLDESFGNNGLVTTAIIGSQQDEASDVIIQADGKIVVIGRSNRGTLTDSYTALVRYLPNGSIDLSFGGGIVKKQGRSGRAILQLSDGSFRVGGEFAFRTGWLVPVGSSGGFGGETILTDDSSIMGLAGDTDGRVLAVGSRLVADNYVMGLWRFNASGSLDSSFGDAGFLSTAENLQNSITPCGLIVQPDGKYLAAGSNHLLRYDEDGDLDESFSSDGSVEFVMALRKVYTVEIQPDGRLLVAGRSSDGFFTIVRVMGDGLPPTDLNLDQATIAENIAANTMVGIFSTIDPGGEGPFSYSFITGEGDADNGQFEISGDQLLTLASFDYEQTPELKIRVRVSNGEGNTLDQDFIIQVGDDLSEDNDGDGLTQAEEQEYGSSDFTEDSDEDGLSDGDEVLIHGSSPILRDTDGDGVEDKKELTDGTKLTDPDTDDDGLNDGDELAYNADPLLPDTDQDGFLDGYEVATGKSPSDPDDKPSLVAQIASAIEYTFPSAIGKSYRIESSEDLVTWIVVEEGIQGTGNEIQRFYSIRNQRRRLFRVEEEMP